MEVIKRNRIHTYGYFQFTFTQFVPTSPKPSCTYLSVTKFHLMHIIDLLGASPLGIFFEGLPRASNV